MSITQKNKLVIDEINKKNNYLSNKNNKNSKKPIAI